MNIGITGRRKQGKSTLAFFLARRIQSRKDGHTVAIFDPKHCYKNVPGTSNREEFEEMLERGGGAVAYRPLPASLSVEQMSDEDMMRQEFAEFMDALGIEQHLGRVDARRKNLGTVILIIDESWYLQNATQADPWIKTLIRLADSDRVFLLLCTHRPVEFNTGIRAQMDEFFFFRQFLESDLESIEAIGGPELAGSVRSLGDHQVLRYEVNTGKMELWADPSSWYLKLETRDGNIPDSCLAESAA